VLGCEVLKRWQSSGMMLRLILKVIVQTSISREW
jgi:hypothetical protein